MKKIGFIFLMTLANCSFFYSQCENAISSSIYPGFTTCEDFEKYVYVDFNASSVNGEVSYEVFCSSGAFCGSGENSGFIEIGVGDCVSVVFTDEAGCQAVEEACTSLDDYAQLINIEYSESVCEGEFTGSICYDTQYLGGNIEYDISGPGIYVNDNCADNLPCGLYFLIAENDICYPSATIEIECDYNCCTIEGCTDIAACNYMTSADCDDGSCFYDPCETCLGDSDLNGTINVVDLVSVSGNFGCTSNCLGNGDANFDGVVNVFDLIAVSSFFSSNCPDE